MEYYESIHQKWRKQLYRICVIFVMMALTAEIAIYAYDATHKELFLPHNIYRMRFIYIPAGINFLVLIVNWLILRSRLNGAIKNAACCVALFCICGNIQITHYVYGPLLVLPVLAIFATVLFGSRSIAGWITACSFLVLLISWREGALELRSGDEQLSSDVILAALMIWGSYLAARLLISYVSEQLISIMASNRKQKELIEECNMDALMGVRNRKALNNLMGNFSTRTFPEKGDLLMIDVDGFKSINDTYGHIHGDEVLIKLSDILKKNLPKEDAVIYRYGGEEIVVLFLHPETEDMKNIELCDKIRKEFEETRFEFAPRQKITFSGGIVAFRQGLCAEEWVAEADRALYQAKFQGKNRIVRLSEQK